MQLQPPEPVLKIALPLPLRQFYDYLPAEGTPAPVAGQRVIVPFGSRQLVGVVVEVAADSDLPRTKLSRVTDCPDGELPVFTPELLDLLGWCWRYYKHAPGEVYFNALPPLLRKPGGLIPPLPKQYRLTQKGEERLLQPAGRIKAQMKMLEQLSVGPAHGATTACVQLILEDIAGQADRTKLGMQRATRPGRFESGRGAAIAG